MELTAFGELFKHSLDIYKKKLSTLAMLMVLPFVANVIYTLLARKNETTLLGGTASTFNYGSVGAVAMVVLIILLFVSIWIQVATIYAVDGAEAHANPADLLAKSAPLVLPMLLVAILVGLAVLGGLILLIVPGIIFGVWFSFSSFELVLANQHGTAALKSSKALVTGRWGAVFGRYVLLGLSLVAISIAASIVLHIVPSVLRDILTTALSNFFATPIGVIFTYLLYKELKAKPATGEKESNAGSKQPAAN